MRGAGLFVAGLIAGLTMHVAMAQGRNDAGVEMMNAVTSALHIGDSLKVLARRR